MNKDLTEIVFILDRSGSMSNLVSDTIGGFNSFIDEQKTKFGEAKLTTVLFDGEYELLHNGSDIKSVNKLTTKEYFARGSTSLLDAIGKTINTIDNRLSGLKKKEQPKVIFVITTDGQENSSKEYTQSKIKEMIENKQNKNKWVFLFLGANIDSFTASSGLGINSGMWSNYSGTSKGTQSIYTTLNATVGNFRSMGEVSLDWAKDIE